MFASFARKASPAKVVAPTANAPPSAGAGAGAGSGGAPGGLFAVPVQSLKQARRRLSVVSDNKLIEGVATLTLGGGDDSASKAGGAGAGAAAAAAVSVVRAMSGVSKKGYAPYNPRKRNQDALLMEEHKPTGSLLLGVFDGHGEAGDLVSCYFSERLMARLVASPKFMTEPSVALVEELDRIERSLLADSSIDTEFSGTTGVVGLLRGKTLIVANIGDSRAIRGRHVRSVASPASRSGGGRLSIVSSLEAVAITEDHKPDTPSEKARIEAAGGRVFAVSYEDGEDGPYRVWLKHLDIPGLAMSRSLGDTVAHTVGVISTPELHTVELTPEDKVLIFASDGLWEFCSNAVVMDMTALAGGDARKAVDSLIAHANALWMREEQVIDDTTVLVLFLDVPPPP